MSMALMFFFEKHIPFRSHMKKLKNIYSPLYIVISGGVRT